MLYSSEFPGVISLPTDFSLSVEVGGVGDGREGGDSKTVVASVLLLQTLS